ncbi:dihydroneopterin aldolase [Snodgrassella communis]|jgi:7,8-dihydroneopterin aldolase/epimerase/oxygenase|uniref:7,8-dihydroneopterin aldolase n=2 Tax=Snodgrassella TaxID=1193515 RepID=A0A2N9XDQ5_9NEIS|nr:MULTISPECIES: dihydroneopterin aldolase [Snodgrassella]KDN11739.1 Dihydroneopterin aldolase [Snodgrassella communis]KDN14244.1 Dihydroneopterin aldolase [Snodgrassella communis]PIT06629.1 dihydroneopterin aldolase [Snodgrassella communis]PIT11097.1 dihydroneopterin aldolase [Snodgrassella communis]PIT19579.1 dihydroneopterin aldolase [Snodgrassella communis]
MDTIFLHGMSVQTLIGVYQWERQQQQTLLLDLDIGTDFQRAAQSDNIDDTIHYARVAENLCEALAEQEFLLLEALAEYVAQFILTRYGALWVRVKVVKPGILAGVKEVGVLIERQGT